MSSLGLKITPAAQQYLEDWRQKTAGACVLALGLKKTGCSGFAYDLKTLDKIPEGYTSAVLEGSHTLYLENQYWDLLAHLEIDLEVGSLGLKKLVFHNPKEAARCGCGESFSVKRG